MKRNVYLFTIVVFLSSIGLANADEKLSLEVALKMAYKNNPVVNSARKDIKIAEAQYKISSKWANPEVEVAVGNLGKTLEDNPSFSTRHIESEIALTQSFEGWGKKGLKKNIARDEVEQSEAEFRLVWSQVVSAIKEEYTNTLLKKKAVGLAEENLQLAQKFLDQIKIKFDSGDAFNHELSRAKLEVIHVRNDLLAAQKMYVISQGKLNLLLGESIHKSYELIDNFQVSHLDKSYEELVKLALQDRGDVIIQGKEVDKKNKELKLAKRERLPEYDISLFVEREDEIYKGGVGIAFELPIWNFQGNEITQAQLEKEKAVMALNLLESEVALEVYQSFHETDLAKKTHDISIEAIKEANEILRFTTLGYEEGDVSFMSYLENIKAYRETKQGYFESLSNYSIKIAELEQLIGGAHEK